MLCSVIIPCFNSQSTIRDLLECFADLPSCIEIIIVNDGSTDSTYSIIKTSPVSALLVNTENRGVSSARNTGLKLAKGRWIQFIDSDDLIDLDSLLKRIAYAESVCADVVVGNWQNFSSNTKYLKSLPLVKTAAWSDLYTYGSEVACATSFWAPPVAVLFNRTFISGLIKFRKDLPIIQDARFLFDCAYHGATFFHYSEIGAYYRISNNSLSRKSPVAFSLDCLLNGQQIKQLWLQRDENLSQDKLNALQSIFSSVAFELLRQGHSASFEAVNQLEIIGGRQSIGLYLSLKFLKVFGSKPTCMLFLVFRYINVIFARLRLSKISSITAFNA